MWKAGWEQSLVVIDIVKDDIFHMTLRNHMIRVSCDIMGGFPLIEVAALASLVAVGFAKEEMCYVISGEQVIRGSCNFMVRLPSP